MLSAVCIKQECKYSAYPGGHAEGYPDAFARHFSDVYSYIEKGDFDEKPSIEDGRRELVITEAVLRSVNEKRWIEVEYQGYIGVYTIKIKGEHHHG